VELVKLDFSVSFDEAIAHLTFKKPTNHEAKGFHNYHVLRSLWLGMTIDDYSNPPMHPNGLRIRNVCSRISDLRNKYGIDGIKSRQAEEGRWVEYWMER